MLNWRRKLNADARRGFAKIVEFKAGSDSCCLGWDAYARGCCTLPTGGDEQYWNFVEGKHMTFSVIASISVFALDAWPTDSSAENIYLTLILSLVNRNLR